MGNIITFYSYKGGTGRTMALANVGYLLSAWGFKVLMVDWDLEAPGLHNFFKSLLNNNPISIGPGITDIINDFKYHNNSSKPNWENYVINILDNNLLHLLPAGEENAEYSNKLRSIDYNNLYNKFDAGRLFEQLRNEWKELYDFILIDSRTGITDIGGVCTIQMPDILVLLFTATDQSLNGIYDVSYRAQEAQKRLVNDRLRLISIPIPSRFDSKEEFKISQEWMEKFSEKLAPIYKNWLPTSIKPNEILEITKIPYSSYFSFGEKLAVIEQNRKDSGGLSYAYENLASLIANNIENVELFVEERDRYITRASKKKIRTSIDKQRVFISYSRHDQKFLQMLNTHLSALESTSQITIWSDSKIGPGHNWYQEIKNIIDNSTIFILLISADYLASSFIMKEELPNIINKGIESNLKVIPIIVRPCLWEQIPFINNLQVFPTNGKALSSMDNYEMENQLVNITREIANIIKKNDNEY